MEGTHFRRDWIDARTLGRRAAAVNLSAGDAAPAFEARDDRGRLWRSADHYGKRIVVVYFYPADMTGGCTSQACGFRDDKAELVAILKTAARAEADGPSAVAETLTAPPRLTPPP